jgi:hypothetical protein
MSTQRKPLTRRESDHDNLGLLANGSSGAWDVAVDETTSGPDRWFVQLEGPAIYCSFEIPSPWTVSEALQFLRGRTAGERLHAGASEKNCSLVIGKHAKTPVVLVRDDEYRDRCFLVIGPDTALARLSIAGKDLKDLTDALQQAAEDIEEDR